MSKFFERNLLFVFPLIFFVSIRYGYDFNGLYGQDAHRYYTYSYELTSWIFGKGELGHFVWPVMYPLIGGLMGFIIGHNDLIMQLLSSLGLTLAVYSTYQLHEVNTKKENLKPYYFVMLGLSPIMLKHSVLIMSDMLCLGFIMATWNSAFQYQKNNRWKNLLQTALFAGLAFMTRYSAIVLLVVPLFWVVKTIIQKRDWVFSLLGVFIILLTLLPHLIIKSSSTEFLSHSWLQEWSVTNFFKSEFTTIEGYNSYIFPNIGYLFYPFFHPLYFGLGAILIFFLKPKKDFKEKWFIWLGLGIYLLFLAGIPYQNKRFLLLTVPFVTMVFAPPFFRFFKLLKERLKLNMVFVVFIIFVQLGLFTYTFSNVYKLNKIEQQLAEYISGFPQKTIYGFGIDIALKSYLTDRNFQNLWENEYNRFTRNSLVVFNEEKFAEQWKNKNPMINWEKMNDQYEIRKVRSFQDGWTLYELR